MTKKPAAWESSMSDYLSSLRNADKTSKYGALPYLVRDFSITKEEARDCLFYWMENAE